MTLSFENLTGDPESASPLAMVRRAARLLVEDSRTIRTDISRQGQKFPLVELVVTTPDFDRDQGLGSRVRYLGIIDRATRQVDIFGDPTVKFEIGAEYVDVPVVNGRAMIVDEAKWATMPPEQRLLAFRVAGNMLTALEVPVVQADL